MMNAHASPPLAHAGPDMSLASVLTALAPHGDKALVFAYAGRHVQAGYHVTEVKAGSFVTLDCGGNPDAWQETILQVEDIPADAGDSFMKVGKFRSILAQVDRTVRLNDDARLTIEISRPDEAMQVYDVAGIDFDDDQAVVHLGARPAICKPRHRAALARADACCPTSSAGSSATACCA
jgi:hypothetical protein